MSSDKEYKIVTQNSELETRDKFELFRSGKFYLLCHGCCILLFYTYFAYMNATISTLEKRFHIPSQNSGFILGSFDAGSICAPFLGYYVATRHRPKWLSFIIFILAVCAFQCAMLHVYYGPGQDALALTKEFGTTSVNTSSDDGPNNLLCRADGFNETRVTGETEVADFFPQIYLYANQIFGGVFGAVHEGIGISYMDDNVSKSKMPIYLSIIQSFRTAAPLLGFNLATVTLSQYIAPFLTPTITEKDTRWIGAWWMGWLVIGSVMLILSALISRFPKTLKKEKYLQEKLILEDTGTSMPTTFARILKNKIYVFNIISTMGCFLGGLPFWMFTAKYIEVQYKVSASESSFLFGTIVQGAAASGTLLSGYLVFQIKPSARRLAMLNILIAVVSSCFIYTYTLLDCSDDKSALNNCIADCECDSVKFNPICGDDGVTYVSPCHAGCINVETNSSSMYFTDCSCIVNNGTAYSGACPVDCSKSLNLFLLVMSISCFIASTTKPNIYLFAMRAVDPADKTVALAAMIMIVSYLAYIPSPIIYGWIMDQTCIFWNNASEGTGNCWRYDEEAFRFNFNMTAITFLLLGSLFGDGGLWYYAKNLKLFDDNDTDDEDESNCDDVPLKDIIL